MSTEGGTKAVVAALLANVGIAIAKFVGFLVTRSSSMLAESIHSVADSANQVLLLVGGRRSRRDADEAHQFGYGRERYFWAFVVAIVLFLLGGMFAIFEGVEKLLHPHEIESPGWAIGILLVGDGHGRPLVPHGRSRGPATEVRPDLVRLHSQVPRTPSCRSCCSRTSGR